MTATGPLAPEAGPPAGLLVRRLPHPGRVALAGGWWMARGGAGVEAGADDDAQAGAPPRPPSTGWQAIDAPRPVGAALAALGAWSIDGPARRFDAETWWFRLRLDRPAFVARPGEGEGEGGGDGAGAWLGLDGLATCWRAWFNGAPIGAGDNMFLAHALALPATAWRDHDNELLLRFDPLDAALATRRPRPRWRTPMLAHQQLRALRTTLLGRVPGWWPEAAVVGPWRGVWLEPAAGGAPEVVARHADVVADAARGCDVGRLTLAVRWPGMSAATALASVTAVLARGDQVVERPLAADPAAPGTWRLEGDTSGGIDGVARWWPRTHGEPALYTLALIATPADGGPAVTHPLGTVGFRTIDVDASGDGFALRVNGVRLFCRGACWTPPDPLQPGGADDAVRAQVALLAGAGANMLRVSGATVPATPALLAACDAAGVMVWTEFMVGSVDVPADDPAWAASFEAEARQQLAAWREHACIAVVCGNSEVSQQAAMWGADRAAWTPALFHERVPAWVREALPGTPYWPSSAHGGAFPFQPSAGTCSAYGVGAYRRPVAEARSAPPRFATECLAFAQVPDDAALARLAALQPHVPLRAHAPAWKERVPRDLGAGWDFDDVRDHYVEALFGLDADARRALPPATGWALARAAMAELAGTVFDAWRDPATPCDGALVWFLQDPRVGAGWGLLDEQGHPKAVFHALARAWQPVHVGLVDGGLDGFRVHVANDGPSALGGTLHLAAYARGEIVVGQATHALSLPPHGAWRGAVLAGFDGFLDLAGVYGFGPPAADVLVATLRDAEGRMLSQAVRFLPGHYGPRPLAPAAIGLRAEEVPGGVSGDVRRVRVGSRAAARAVHFDCPGWRAHDEYFDLPPGGERVVAFSPAVAGTRPGWRVQATAINADGWATVAEAS